MGLRRQLFIALRVGAAGVVIGGLVACGGGSSGGPVSTPAPPTSPSPTPSPAPSPTPTPSASTFQTAEYSRSTGPSFHRAISGWQLGAVGRNVAIGIIDSGVDTTNPEFAGRISAASADVAGTRELKGDDDHGTMVALVAAAARNDSGIMGIAHEATVMAMRADTPGSCSIDDGCSFSDSAIASGIDRAVTNGAKVINLSLGGDAAGSQVRAAVSRAATAGVVIVVSAGNGGDTSGPESDPDNPEPFASSLRAAGNGNVIIAGSVDNTGAISSFTNRAGTEANWFLGALGERICCAYEDGAIKVTTSGGQQFTTTYSGTSFSAPQIAGAAALLRQAFPNLSAAQVVNLLLTSAREAGASGTDATYGRGILDIANAFAPQGTTTLAGSSSEIPLSGTTFVTSAAMGDAVQSASLNAIMLDGYSRAYQINLAKLGQVASMPMKLTGALLNQLRDVATGTERLSLAYSIDARTAFGGSASANQLRLSQGHAHRAKVLAARVVAQLSPKTSLGFAFSQGAEGLVAQLGGSRQAAFLIAGSPLDDVGFRRRPNSAIALRRSFGSWGVTASAENAYVFGDERMTERLRGAQMPRSARLALAVDRTIGDVEISAGSTLLMEQRTILGAKFQDAIGSSGAQSLFIDSSLAWRPSQSWRLGGAWRQGFTFARPGGWVAAGSLLESNAWSFDVTRFALLDRRDSLAFRISQPLRVSSGGINMLLPVEYSYDTLLARKEVRLLALAPAGREIATELAWRSPLAQGWGSASLFYRVNPGHFASAPDDKGVSFSWSRRF